MLQKRMMMSFVVIDGKEQTHYENVKNLIFSPDGKRLAYVANDSGKWFAVIDGNEENRYDRSKIPVFSPDSKQVAYAVRNEDKWFVL